MNKIFLRSKKGESFLFIIYKGDKNIDVHVSVEDNVKFRGSISKTKDIDKVDLIFSDRFYDFSYNELPDNERIYVVMTFLENCSLNVIFKAKLSDFHRKAKHGSKESKTIKFMSRWKDPDNFHQEIIQEIDKNFEIVEPEPLIQPIVSKNRKQAAWFNERKKMLSKYRKEIKNERVQSAKRLRINKREFKKDLIQVDHFYNSLRRPFNLFRQAVIDQLQYQRNWIIQYTLCSILLKMVEKFDQRVNEIRSYEIMIRTLEDENNLIQYPQILHM